MSAKRPVRLHHKEVHDTYGGKGDDVHFELLYIYEERQTMYTECGGGVRDERREEAAAAYIWFSNESNDDSRESK